MKETVSKTNKLYIVKQPTKFSKVSRGFSSWFIEGKFPTFLGVLLLVVEAIVGVLFVQNKNISDNTTKSLVAPKDIKISNISDKGFTVSWITDKKTTGFVEMGENENNQNRRQYSQQGDQKVYVHTVNITDVNANKTYFFVIYSDKFKFTESGKPWKVTVGTAITNELPLAKLMAGSIVNKNSEPVENASVFLTVNGSALLSTVTDGNGQWFANLATARNQTLDSYIKITKDKTPVEIYIQSGIFGIAYGRTTVGEINILDPIKIGEVYILNPKDEKDFNQEVPGAELILP